MNALTENLANLFKVKTIITIAITSALVYGFFVGRVSAEVFSGLASSVVTYYFTRKNTSEEIPQ